MVDLIRILGESGQNNYFLCAPCVLKGPEGAGERKKLPFPQGKDSTISKGLKTLKISPKLFKRWEDHPDIAPRIDELAREIASVVK